jgi:hypothetical protein
MDKVSCDFCNTIIPERTGNILCEDWEAKERGNIVIFMCTVFNPSEESQKKSFQERNNLNTYDVCPDCAKLIREKINSIIDEKKMKGSEENG